MRRDKIRTRSATVSPGCLGPVLPGAAAAVADDVCVCVCTRALWKLACASLCFACSQNIRSGTRRAHLCALRAARIKKGVLRAATKYMRIEKIKKIKKGAFLAARKYMRIEKI